jgi:Flp pilus assembly CpaF family ATPase
VVALTRPVIAEHGLWLWLRRGEERKLGLVEDRSTVGSALSNHITLLSGDIRSLHGQFLIADEQWIYRDFDKCSEFFIKPGEAFKIADWNCVAGQLDKLSSLYESFLLEDFKMVLKSYPSLNLSQALEEIRKRWFFSQVVPPVIERLLTSQIEQVSLVSPIERLLEDEEVSDILVEAFDRIWIERKGELEQANVRFINAETYQIYLENLLAALHKSIDDVRPYLDFVLSDGSRGHLIVPPLTDGSRYLSIRKKKKSMLSLDQLNERGMFSPTALQAIRASLNQRKNILISGSTGSGKTTLLKSILCEIPEKERTIVIEDTPELSIDRQNTAFLYSRTDSLSQLPAITLRELVRQSLRMRPDRIIIGEVRGEEALDLMHAMNTGHRGCLGSLHANSNRDALSRLQGLIQMSSSTLSENAMRDLIARNLHLLLHCARDIDGKRRVSEYSFVRGIDQNQILLETHAC